MKLKNYLKENNIRLTEFHNQLCDQLKWDKPPTISATQRWINGLRKPGDHRVADAILVLTNGLVTYRDIFGP